MVEELSLLFLVVTEGEMVMVSLLEQMRTVREGEEGS
jgi:hypothetical protein